MFRTNNQDGQVRENYSKEEGRTEWQFRNSPKQQPQWDMMAVSTKPLSEHEVQSCFGKNLLHSRIAGIRRKDGYVCKKFLVYSNMHIWSGDHDGLRRMRLLYMI